MLGVHNQFNKVQNLVPIFEDIKREAIKFRGLIDACDKSNAELVTDDFPICNCKLSSMLLIYHFLKIWPNIEITGVQGMAKDQAGEEVISHYWVEIDNIAIDITADQYNLIDDEQLNHEIINNRPFKSVYTEPKLSFLPYKLFRITDRNTYKNGFPTIGEDFIDSMSTGYAQLTTQEPCI